MKNDNIHSVFSLFWLQILNLPASLQNKNTRIGPFPWKRSVLQNPDRERTNQSTGICLRLGLPYNNVTYLCPLSYRFYSFRLHTSIENTSKCILFVLKPKRYSQALSYRRIGKLLHFSFWKCFAFFSFLFFLFVFFFKNNLIGQNVDRLTAESWTWKLVTWCKRSKTYLSSTFSICSSLGKGIYGRMVRAPEVSVT